MSLVDHLEAWEVSWWGCARCRAFPHPPHAGMVVGAVEDCLLSHVIGIRRTKMLKTPPASSKSELLMSPPVIFVGDQAVDDILGVGDTPNNGVHGQFLL